MDSRVGYISFIPVFTFVDMDLRVSQFNWVLLHPKVMYGR